MRFYAFLCMASVTLAYNTCNAQDLQITPPAPPPLHSILDTNDILGHQTPAQTASLQLGNTIRQHGLRPLTNMVSSMEAATTDVTDGSAASKTSIFNQSLTDFIKKFYNHKQYALELSQNASHFSQFIEFSNELNLGVGPIYIWSRLMHNKFKSCEIVDDTVCAQLLETVPPLLEHYFAHDDTDANTNDLAFIKKQLESMILSRFTNHLDTFRLQPDIFISSLAQDLALHYQQEQTKQHKAALRAEMTERLRNTIIRMHETILSKVMWSPQNHGSIWPSFKNIAHGLQLLGEYNVANHMDDLDDLYWSLVHRFCYFLELTGGKLPMIFYDQMQKDLEERAVYFLEYREQDEGIRSKKEILMSSIMQAKARAIAYEKKGLLISPITL